MCVMNTVSFQKLSLFLLFLNICLSLQWDCTGNTRRQQSRLNYQCQSDHEQIFQGPTAPKWNFVNHYYQNQHHPTGQLKNIFLSSSIRSRKNTFALDDLANDFNSEMNVRRNGILSKLSNLAHFWHGNNSRSDSQSSHDIQLDTLGATYGPFRPKGIYGVIQVALRRYLLNFLDRDEPRWAQSVSSRSDLNSFSGGQTGFYVLSTLTTSDASNRTNAIQFVRQQRELKSKAGPLSRAIKLVRNPFAGLIRGVQNRMLPQMSDMDIDDYIDDDFDVFVEEDDYSDDEVRIFATKTSQQKRMKAAIGARSVTRRRLSLPSPISLLQPIKLPAFPALPNGGMFPVLAAGITSRVDTLRHTFANRITLPFSNKDKIQANHNQSPNVLQQYTIIRPNKERAIAIQFDSIPPVKVSIQRDDDSAEDRALWNRSEKRIDMPRLQHTVLAAVPLNPAQSETDIRNQLITIQQIPQNNQISPFGLMSIVGTAITGVFSGAVNGTVRAIGNIPNIRPPHISLDIRMPWEIYHRGAIPFFDNALHSEQIPERVIDNVIAQVMASDAADLATQNGIIDQSYDSANVRNKYMNRNFGFSTQASQLAADLQQFQRPLSASGVLTSAVDFMFPILSTAARLVENTVLRRDVSQEIVEVSPIDRESHGVRGSAIPGEGVGLGLGMDPEAVEIARQEEELASEASTDTAKVFTPPQTLSQRVYRFTIGPIVSVPSNVYRLTRKILGKQTAVQAPLLNAISPFDEEAEGLQQNTRQAVKAKEVLPASVLDNMALDGYNPSRAVEVYNPLPTAQDFLNSNSRITSNAVNLQQNLQLDSNRPMENRMTGLYQGTSAGTADINSSTDSANVPLIEVKSGSRGAFVVEDQTQLNNLMPMPSTRDLRVRPQFVEKERVPVPTKADFTYIDNRRVLRAVSAALSISTERDAKEFLRDIGLRVLITALNEFSTGDNREMRIEVVKGMCRLVRMERQVADELAASKETISVLIDLIETPMRGFRSFRISQADRDREERTQREAVALILRLVRSSDKAVEILRYNNRLRVIFAQLMAQGEIVGSSSSLPPPSAAVVLSSSKEPDSTSLLSYIPFFSPRQTPAVPTIKAVKKYVRAPNTTVVDYPELKTYQMARVAAWALGGVQWKPKQPGQKGLRILSLDGGGTKGVLSIALIKELMQRIGNNYPHEVFDIICGTSTGAIIAGLLGLQMRSIQESETLYDDLIDKIFSKRSNLKLVQEQAAYDEQEFERILYALCGEELLVDSNRNNCARVFFVSTKVNNNPPLIKIWRNYNYPPDQSSRYQGAFRVNTLTAVRATTAAPTFFTPVQWQGGLYCDGALVANNPTAIALQEAKILYPGVPVEMVVSMGTGYFNRNSNVQSMGWDLLVNHIIATSVDTEDVHSLLADFLPPDKYFRFNPPLADNIAIDEKNKTVLTDMKRMAKEAFSSLERGNGAESKRFEQMIKSLRGGKN